MACFVLVHGGWYGGWVWQPVARLLRAAGHDVFTPTLTGLGERVHLAHPQIDLTTHIQDIVNVLTYENLHQVILVGHSVGGMVVAGVADRVPERIAQLIYLDALVPKDGESVADIAPALVAALADAARPHGDGWQIPAAPPQGRKTPHPLKTLQQAVRLTNQRAARLPRTYIWCTRNSLSQAPIMAQTAARVRASDNWRYHELATDHVPHETHPQEVAALLLELL